jgi:mRNA-degrading endonuclease RelE of RelBE toxin-antitoxin system
VIGAQIVGRIRWLAEHPEALRFALRHAPPGLEGLHKYQAGDYRILLWVDHDERALTLYGVAHRSTIYRRLK